MKMKFVPIVFLVLILFCVSGCSLFQTESSKPHIVRSGSSDDPEQLTLTLSQVPLWGKTADIILAPYICHPTFQIAPKDLDNVRLWLEFTWANIHGSFSEAETAVPVSPDEVRIGGDTSWQDSMKAGETIELHSTIQLPREGVWAITGYFTGEDWQESLETQIRVAVSKDAAAITGTREFYSSPLAYLGYYGYGQGGGRTLGLNEFQPVIMILDISKAPKPGEEVILTCNIHSFYDDLSDFPAQITFSKRTSGNKTTRVSGDRLLVEGELNWVGDLRKGANQFSAVIKFPEEGDWKIYVGNNYPVQYNYTVNGQHILGDNLELHVSKKLSYFGWKQ
ncbi:MAG: hypothetical protein JXA46_07540 [Dehalococcoidales bacterium]|nr:hypothetical protein [Dehalococcoidales bacterium]